MKKTSKGKRPASTRKSNSVSKSRDTVPAVNGATLSRMVADVSKPAKTETLAVVSGGQSVAKADSAGMAMEPSPSPIAEASLVGEWGAGTTAANPSVLVRDGGDSDDLGSEPVAVASPVAPGWEGTVELIDPNSLVPHPAWIALLGDDAPEAQEERIASMRLVQVPVPIIVVGSGCFSSPNTILIGHDACVAAASITPVAPVPVIRRTDLSRDAEEIIVVRGALAGHHARRLGESKLAELEAQLKHLYARNPGFRSDIQTSVGSNGGRPPGDTLDLVAAASGSTRNSVADRQKIFASPVAPRALKEAVDAAIMSRTSAAALVREAERAPEVNAAVAEVGGKPLNEAEQHPVLIAAREELEAIVRERLRKPPKKTSPVRSTTDEPIQLEGVWHEQVLVAMGSYRGRRVRIQVEGVRISITDLGPVPRAQSPKHVSRSPEVRPTGAATS